MSLQIQIRRDTAVNWSTINPILADGEIGFEKDNGKLKFGNGLDEWNNLPYYSGGSSAEIDLSPYALDADLDALSAKLEQIQIGNNLGLISLTDTPPATGKYRGDVATAGTYTNFKNSSGVALAFTQGELDINFGYIYVAENVAEKILSKKPAGANVVDGFASASTTSAGSAKNDKILKNSIKDISFGVVGSSLDFINFIPTTVENIGSPNNYIANNGSFSLSKGSAQFGGKPAVFAENKIKFTIQQKCWVVYGKNSNSSYLALYLNTGANNVTFVYFAPNGSFGSFGQQITTNINIDTSKEFIFEYKGATIDVFQDGALLLEIPSSNISGVNFINNVFCAVADAENQSVSYTAKILGVIPNNPNIIPVESVVLNAASNGFPVVYSGNNFKILQPFFEKKVTLYGDSITVAYDSANYASQILAKLGCSTVTRSGEIGQSFAGNLQNTTNVNALVATTPALVVIHSVNDHRVNATIGTMADSAGTASAIGGLKTICNALISANKNVKIILCTPMTYGAVAGGYPASNEPNASGKYMFEYAAAIVNFARSYGIAIADLSSLCGFRPQIEGTSNRVFTSDGVHPNAVGYEKMTTLVADVVNKM